MVLSEQTPHNRISSISLTVTNTPLFVSTLNMFTLTASSLSTVHTRLFSPSLSLCCFYLPLFHFISLITSDPQDIPTLQIAFAFAFLKPFDNSSSLKGRVRLYRRVIVHTLQVGVAYRPHELYESAQLDTVFTLLVHKVHSSFFLLSHTIIFTSHTYTHSLSSFHSRSDVMN